MDRIKAFIKEWEVNSKILNKLDNDINHKNNSSLIIKQINPEIQNLILKAFEFYNNGDFIESAKFFRQIGRTVRDIEFNCEVKGNHNGKNILNNLTGKEWLRHTKSWLIVDGKPSDFSPEIKDHPASFPPDLAKHFIEFFTKENEWVFDPFMGIGSTLAACKDLNRNCWGTELNSEYAEYAQRRVKMNPNKMDCLLTFESEKKRIYRVFNDDCRNCLDIWEKMKYPKVKLVLTSPPYWNMLNTSRGGVKSTSKQRMEQGLNSKYGNDPKDLGNITDYYEYIEEIHRLFRKIAKIMMPNSHIIIILQNIRPKDGIMRPLAWELAIKLRSFLILKQEFIWCQDQKFMGIWGYPTTYVSNMHHHYCLVFQTPNSQKSHVQKILEFQESNTN